MEKMMLSNGIVLFWNAFDEPEPVTIRATALLRQTRAQIARVWKFRTRT